MDSPAVLEWWLKSVYPAFDYTDEDRSRLVRLALHHAIYYDRPRLIALLLRQGFVSLDMYAGFQAQPPHEEAAINDRGHVLGILMDYFNLTLAAFPLETIQMCRINGCTMVLSEWSERFALQAQPHDGNLDALWAEIEAQRQAL
jgi:hypothetical protein